MKSTHQIISTIRPWARFDMELVTIVDTFYGKQGLSKLEIGWNAVCTTADLTYESGFSQAMTCPNSVISFTSISDIPHIVGWYSMIWVSSLTETRLRIWPPPSLAVALPAVAAAEGSSALGGGIGVAAAAAALPAERVTACPEPSPAAACKALAVELDVGNVLETGSGALTWVEAALCGTLSWSWFRLALSRFKILSASSSDAGRTTDPTSRVQVINQQAKSKDPIKVPITKATANATRSVNGVPPTSMISGSRSTTPVPWTWAIWAIKMIAFRIFLLASNSPWVLLSLPSSFLWFSSIFFIPSSVLGYSKRSALRTLVPKSAASCVPGQCLTNQSPWATLWRRVCARFRRWRVRHDPESPPTMATADEESVCDVTLARKSSNSSMTARTASAAPAPSMTSMSSLSAVETEMADCLLLFQSSKSSPQNTKVHPWHVSLNEESVNTWRSLVPSSFP